RGRVTLAAGAVTARARAGAEPGTAARVAAVAAGEGRALARRAWSGRPGRPARGACEPASQRATGARGPCALGRRLRALRAERHTRVHGSAAKPREDALPCAVSTRAPSHRNRSGEGGGDEGARPGTRGRKGLEGERSPAPPPRPRVWGLSVRPPPPRTSRKPRLSPPLCRLPSTLTQVAGVPTFPVGAFGENGRGRRALPALLEIPRQVAPRNTGTGTREETHAPPSPHPQNLTSARAPRVSRRAVPLLEPGP
ncbi:serine/arginine repetitive matrix protein 3-like, partial [Sapajus apella]|uniref:Serine/arginine repetitive matrix protein 3-like n=1 Tax=Sapajus apella TaxID=9515 RepID=A0A6J3HGY1_SAPAP